MSDHILGGIGYNARNLFTPNQTTPTPLGGHMGIHMAVVVDDIDDYALDNQKKGSLGRVWVYIPGVSARNPELTYARYTPTREPRQADGTPGQPIPDKRNGFIMAYPMVPHAGSDRLREAPNQPDGRNPPAGQSNAYGDFVQARNGDVVAVCFLGGDPGKCYILGHVPKTAEHSMVPGLKQTQTTASGAGVSTNVGPSYNKGEANKDTKPSTVFFNNLTDSGLIQDPLRGCGTSASDRETPSRVRGIKTPGDPDTGMTGHQIIMDDHPDSQLMRFRTSKGAQVLLSDTGDFIYVCSATGKTWIEIDDAGHCHVYAKSSISIHSEQDFNLVCDRDFNLHVGGNANWIIKGDTRIRMNKGANFTVGEGGGDFDITTIQNFHVKTQGELRVGTQKGITMKSADFLTLQATKDMNLKTAADWHTDVKTIDFKASDAMTIQTGKDMLLKTGAKFNVLAANSAEIQASDRLDFKSASLIQLDAPSIKSSVEIVVGGSSSSVSIDDVKSIDDANDPNQADIPLEYSVSSAPSTSGPPKSPSSLTKYAAPVVPNHEPWPGHRGANPGHDAAIDPSSIPKLL